MKDIEGIKHYLPIEEKINIISHAIGFILSIVALVLLVTYANLHGNVWRVVSFSIFVSLLRRILWYRVMKQSLHLKTMFSLS